MTLSERERLTARWEQWLRDGYTDNEAPLDDYGKEVVRECLASLLAEAGTEEPLTYTTSGEPTTDAEGYVRALYFYQRGPNDPLGNQWVWTCPVCDWFKGTGHAENCTFGPAAPAQEQE